MSTAAVPGVSDTSANNFSGGSGMRSSATATIYRVTDGKGTISEPVSYVFGTNIANHVLRPWQAYEAASAITRHDA
jgi:hypothetical protein